MQHKLPTNADMRSELNDEFHVYPYEPLVPPVRIVTLVMLPSRGDRAQEVAHLQQLCAQGNHDTSRSTLNRLYFDGFLLKVESHHEFTRYKFIASANIGHATDPFANSPLSLLPEGWLTGLPGRLLVALDTTVLPYPEQASHQSLFAQYAEYFSPTSLAASQIGRSKSLAMTDFQIRDNGMTRMLVFSQAELPAQIGRLTYRLIDIETYRMLALVILPQAKNLLKKLPLADTRLKDLTGAISEGGGMKDEQLMERLTALAAEVEDLIATHYRPFSIAQTRFDLVLQRLDELYEHPIGPQPTMGGFLRRRMQKARSTSESAFHWLDQMAMRVSQASQSLRTRIDVNNAAQNRGMLAAMNRRFQLQLRLQQAAELLSVAIFTYYSVNLLEYIYQELALLLAWDVQSVLFKSLAAPVLAIAAVVFIYRRRAKVTAKTDTSL
ncbi:MAG: DUF3422 domain-containing protein [Mariprofundus sp.]|nr:DUF3422 domain-containing protein [Mariprofundus sp.]